jgi:dynactin 1
MTAVVIGKDPEVRGTVQYVGQTTFASGYWVGLRLETPTGKNDGSVQGTQYFECPPLHGLFVRPVQLQILDDEEGDEDHEEGGDGEEDFSQQNGLNVKEREREQFEKKSTGDEYVLRTNADTLRETLNAAYALKVKLAKSMSLLNRQLETIEVLEEKVESVPGVVDDDCVEFMSTIVELLHEEEKLIAEFKTYLPNVTKEN